MQVIQTPTADPDKFGPGLHGFKGGVNPPPTQLSPEWFDSVQMEIVNVIIGMGIPLDEAQRDQLKQAIDNYVFDSPKVLGILRIDGGGELRMEPGTTIRAKSGATILVESGATLLGEPGSFIEFDEIDVATTSTLADVNASGTITAPTVLITSGGNILAVDLATAIAGFGSVSAANLESPRVKLTSPAAPVPNTLTRTSGSVLVWGVAPVHTSAPGYVFASGLVASAGAAALQTITTSAAAPAPADGSPIRLVGELSALMTVANTVTIQLQAETAPGTGVYANTGASYLAAVPSAANDWKHIRIVRDHAPGGQALRYRLLVSANGGSSVAIESATITAGPSA